MGLISKTLGAGLGLASEAIHAARSRSQSGNNSTSQPDPAAAAAGGPSSSELAADPLPAYDGPGIHNDKKKSHKAAEAGGQDGDLSDSGDDDDNESVMPADDEAAWELDDMAERVAPPSYEESETGQSAAAVGVGSAGAGTGEKDGQAVSEEAKVKKEEQMVRDLVRLAGPVPQPLGRIPCPVIIPQRRPRQKDRGFVRAYAPVLADCGISQDVFLKFLKDWHQASKSDPWIDIMFVAAGIAGMAPELTVMIVTTIIQVAAGTARELQSRHRRNTFLGRVNEDLLMPRGLFAMVMAFKDQVPGQQTGGGPLSRLSSALGQTLFSAQRLDINQTAAKYSNPDPNMSKLKKGLKDLRLTSGKTYGEVELPESAALVYPDIDRAAARDLAPESGGKGKKAATGTNSTGTDTGSKEGIKEKWKSAGKWVQDYLDRRAQATWEMEHGSSAVAIPSESRTPFASRFSDPSHPANSGSLISLLTGGYINPAARRQDRRAARYERRALRRDYKDSRRVARGRSPRGPRPPIRDRRRPRKGIIKKIMQQDVMYLLIVNLPTASEVDESVSRLEQAMTAEGIA